MKIVRSIALLLLCAVLFMGCFTTKVVAPFNDDVQLASEGDVLEEEVIHRNWYALWGLVSISETDTEEVIDRRNFTKVRVETKFRFVDMVINIFTGLVSIVTHTTVVEGERNDSVSSNATEPEVQEEQGEPRDH